jgi:hypothetical protein
MLKDTVQKTPYLVFTDFLIQHVFAEPGMSQVVLEVRLGIGSLRAILRDSGIFYLFWI